jgi:hypothetical protein
MLFQMLAFNVVLLVVLCLIACAGRIGLACASVLAFAGALFIGVKLLNIIVPTISLVITASVGFVCLRERRGAGTFFRGALAGLAVGMALACTAGGFYVNRCLSLQEKYPYVSLAPRLAYEEGRRRLPVRTDSGTDGRLKQIEGEVGKMQYQYYKDRSAGLELIHRDAVYLFVNSPGFGPGRNLGPSPAHVEPNEYPLIPFDTDDSGAADDPLAFESPKANGAVVSNSVAPPPYLWTSHSSGLINFINKDGFGHVRDREHVAGFQPHQFSSGVTFGASKDDGWRVRRLQLVSLLKSEEPAVYLTDHLPRMDRLGDGTTTRPLDSFERDALESLRRGEDLVAVPGERVVRVLGSIRAVNQCLHCHTAERGELLGAFSYVLQPGRPSR